MTETIETQQNGVPPAPAAGDPGPQVQLPEGAIMLPPQLVAVLTRLMQQNQQVQDVLYSFLQGKGRSDPLALVLPAVLLLPPKEQ